MSGATIASRRRRLRAQVATDSQLAREEAETLIDLLEVGLDVLDIVADATRLGGTNLVSLGVSVGGHLAHAYIEAVRTEWTGLTLHVVKMAPNVARLVGAGAVAEAARDLGAAALGELALGLDMVTFVSDVRKTTYRSLSVVQILVARRGHERPARVFRFAVRWLLHLLSTKELEHVRRHHGCLMKSIMCDLHTTLNILGPPPPGPGLPSCLGLLRMHLRLESSLAR